MKLVMTIIQILLTDAALLVSKNKALIALALLQSVHKFHNLSAGMESLTKMKFVTHPLQDNVLMIVQMNIHAIHVHLKITHLCVLKSVSTHPSMDLPPQVTNASLENVFHHAEMARFHLMRLVMKDLLSKDAMMIAKV